MNIKTKLWKHKVLTHSLRIVRTVAKKMHNGKFVMTVLVITIVTGFLVVSPTISSSASKLVIGNSGKILAIQPLQPLHVEGRWIKDQNGSIVYLRGVNYGGFNNNPNGQWSSQGGTVNEHFAAMQSWGINFVRYTLTTDWWVGNNNNYRQNIRDSIVIAQDYGIYILLCPWRISGTGGFASPFQLSYNDFMSFWLSVMNELGDLPNFLIDPWNEPTASGGNSQAAWQTWVQDLINNIRGAGYNHLILYQWGYGTGVNGRIVNWYNQYPVTGTNIVISTHLYQSGYGYSSDYDTLKSEMETSQIKDVGEVLNKSLLIGEVGATSSELTWWANVLPILNEWQLGYAAWTWMSGQAWSVRVGTSFEPNSQGQILIDAIAAGTV